MAFTLRSFEDETKARMGVVECASHDLFKPFPVLFEKENEFVAHFKCTVLLMPSGLHRITGIPLDLKLFDSEYKITEPSLKNLLALSLISKANKRKKRKALADVRAAGEDFVAKANLLDKVVDPKVSKPVSPVKEEPKNEE